MNYKGIDVSRHQGAVDWAKVKAAGIEFALIRAGYGMYLDQIDERFTQNMTGAIRNGIPVGVYWYSYADKVEEAREEARVCLEVIQPYKGKITLPVFFDQEYEDEILAASKATRTECCKVFLDTIKKAGYTPGMYASQDWLLNKINRNQLPSDTVIWCAKYSNAAPSIKYDIWQYTSEGRVAGINGDVDLDTGVDILPKATWKKTSAGWTYGTIKSEWIKDKGLWYYLDENGIAVTGWHKLKTSKGTEWFYFLTAQDAIKTGGKECSCYSLDKS